MALQAIVDLWDNFKRTMSNDTTQTTPQSTDDQQSPETPPSSNKTELHRIVQNITAPNGKEEKDFNSKEACSTYWNELKNTPTKTNIARIWYKSIQLNNSQSPRLWTIVQTYGSTNDQNIIKKYLATKYPNEFQYINDDEEQKTDNDITEQKITNNNETKMYSESIKTDTLSSVPNLNLSLQLSYQRSRSTFFNLNHFSPTQVLIFPRKENGQTFEGMNTIIAKYYEYMQDKTYFKNDSRGKFLAFVENKNLNENDFWIQLFEVPINKCIYLQFDKRFPLYYRKNKKPTRRYTADIDGIDSALYDYYLSLGYGNDYFDNDNIGKFKAYCEETDLDFDSLADELDGDNIEECNLMEMDDNFPLEPLDNNNENENESDEEKDKRIFEVLKHCFLWGVSPTDYYVNLPHNQNKLREFLQYCYDNGQPLKPLMTILDYDLDIENAKNLERSKNLIQIQTNAIFYQNVMNDVQYTKVFSIGYSHRNYNFLLYLMDSYQREKLYQYFENKKQVDIKAWVDKNWILNNKLKKTKLTPEYLCSALRGNIRHFRKTLILYPEVRIYDSIEIISRYIISFTEFIKLYLMEYYNITSPFQIDAMIAINRCKRYEVICDNNLFSSDTDITMGGNNEQKREVLPDKHFDIADVIGDVIDKLTNEKCLHVTRQINNIENINDILAECFDEFKEKLLETKNCELDYPQNRRFCIFIDRRCIREGNPDELIIFSPPNNVNIIPEDHIPQSMTVMSSECLIPQIGYNLGEKKSPSEMIKMNLEKISTDNHCKGQLMTFSFHIEQLNEIRCYMYWYGQSIRFYPQDIKELLPIIFDMKYKENEKFIKNDMIKRMVNGVLLNDIYFEHYYRNLTQKEFNEFPINIYDGLVWTKNAKSLVFGYLRQKYNIFVHEISRLILKYYCYY